MAVEKVNIASLSINFDDVIKESARYKTQIDELKKAQKELDTTTTQGQQAYVKNAAELKNLSKAYRDNQTFAASLEEVNKDLTRALDIENKSTQELRDSRRNLNQISKQIKGDSEEEIELRRKLNTAIDQQTEALREQSSEFNASKDGIGEYEQGITAALEDLNLFNGGLGGFIQRSQEAGGATQLVNRSLKGLVVGLGNATKAALAFIATPIGAVLALIAGAFLLVQNAMNRSEESTNKIRKAVSGVTGIFQKLLKVLQPLGDFLIDGIVKGFELAEIAIFQAMENLAKALEFLGFDEQAESLRNFTKEVGESVAQSKALTAAEIELDKARRVARKTQLDFQKDAERLRQMRDNENLSIRERIQANEDLGAVLREQLKEELRIAETALRVANLRIQAEGETSEALDAQAEALTEIADIQERITSQESEQLTNRVSLQREAADKLREIQDAAIQKQQEQLDLFIAQQGLRAKTLAEQLEIERETARQSIEIEKAKLEAKKISQEEYNAAIINIQNELLQKQSELAVDNARRDLESYLQNNQSKIDSERYLSEQIFEEERSRLERLAEQRREFEAKRLEEGVISQQTYNDRINEINEENRIANAELEAEREEARKEKEAEDYENKLIIAEEQFQNEFAIRQSRLEESRQLELANAESTGADKSLINKKYTEFEKGLSRDLALFKAEQNSVVLGGIKNLFGESSALGKAFAIAEITTDTFTNASKAFTQAAVFASNPITLPLATNATIQGGIIIATGAAQAAKVAGVKFAQGGILRGRSHAQGGINTPYGELEGGEAVINKRSTQRFAPLLSRINEAEGGRRFANGGILGSTSSPERLLDIDLLSARLAESFVMLPAPVVSVEEINTVERKVNVIENTSSF